MSGKRVSGVLSDQLCKTLKPPPKGYNLHRCGKVRGLALRVTASGHRSFVFCYSDPTGRERRMTIGEYGAWSLAAAKKRLGELRREVDAGGNPIERRVERRKEPSLGDLWEWYSASELRKLSKANQGNIERDWNGKIGPVLGHHTKLTDLKRSDIQRLIDSVSERSGPTAANRCHSYIRRMLNLAVAQEMVETNVAARARALRAVLSSDADLIDDLCTKMAASIKDRSADYLICAATKLETAQLERTELHKLTASELIGIAADAGEPLIRRAVAALLACATQKNGRDFLRIDHVAEFLDAFTVQALPLHDAVERLANVQADPFCLMLPIVWSRWWHASANSTVVEDELPTPEFYKGIPLHTFDFHTAAGKNAISTFGHRNDEVREVLARWVQPNRWIETACIASFYVDAAPVARRLDWAAGQLLAKTGFIADMTGAGCEFEGAAPVLNCIAANLADLNRHRRAALGASRT